MKRKTLARAMARLLFAVAAKAMSAGLQFWKAYDEGRTLAGSSFKFNISSCLIDNVSAHGQP